MSQVIIWKRDTGGISIFVPSAEALLQYTMHQMAQIVVPTGVHYKIIDFDEVPNDVENWDLPDEYFNDGVGGG